MSYADQLDTDIHTFLARHERKRLLRFVTVGSVDDGKSTLIGRLLHDTRGVYEDQLEDARTVNADGDETIDFARITDGLNAEREQGITIDVAYRYFTTPNRKFIIADTPGHIQYTRNMATGASTAHVAVILIDARLGVLQQSRRHAYIASLLGIPTLLVAVNKMDLVGYDEAVYDEICTGFSAFAADLNFDEVAFIPMSALAGENVVEAAHGTMPWFCGPTFLDYLETVDIPVDDNLDDFRLPVQYVLRPHLDYRGYAGQLASGQVAVGDPVAVLPSGKTSRVKAIDTWEGELPHAHAPMSVTLRLDDEIDISRGDLLVHPDNLPEVTRAFEAMVVWMSEEPLDPARTYVIKHTTRYVRVAVQSVHWMEDLNALQQVPATTLALNDIGCVSFVAHRPIYVDPYLHNHATGAFVLIDALTNDTLGAGMLTRTLDAEDLEGWPASGRSAAARGVGEDARAERLGHRGAVLWLTGPAAAEVAVVVEQRLFEHGHLGYLLDASDPTFAIGGPVESHLAIAALHVARAGVIAVAVPGTATVASLDEARAAVGDHHFVHIELPATAAAFEAVEVVLGALVKRGVLPD